MTVVSLTISLQFFFLAFQHFNQWHDTFVQIRRLVFLLLPLILSTFPYLLHRIPILNIIIPAPRPPANVPSLSTAEPQSQDQTPLNQLTSKTTQILNHLVPTLRLIKYSHAAIMRSQDTNKTPNSDSKFLTPKQK